MPLLTRTNSNLNPTQLLTTVQELKQSLQSIQPDNSSLTKTITFALVATAIVGIAVYHYIKNQDDKSQGVLTNSVKENNLC